MKRAGGVVGTLLATTVAAVALAAAAWWVLREIPESTGASSAPPERESIVELNVESIPTAPSARTEADSIAAKEESPWELDRTLVQSRRNFTVVYDRHGSSSGARIGEYVEGVVVDRQGQPLDNVGIDFGPHRARTTADGTFKLWFQAPQLIHGDTPLVARKDDYQPALLERFGQRVLDAGSNTLFERIVLDSPALTIRGHFVDSQGRRVGRGRVRVADGTPLDPSRKQSEFLEASAITFESNAGFEIGGLLARKYVLECELHTPLVRFLSPPIAAGSRDVEIALPADALVESVRGHLLTPDGSSLAGAKLDLALQFAPGVHWPRRSQLGGKIATTSLGGAFVLGDVPRRDAWVVVEHASIPTQSLPLTGFDLGQEIELVVRRRARLRMEKLDPSLSEINLDLFEPSGARALLEANDGSVSALAGVRVQLDRGRSGPITSLEGRYRLVVLRERVAMLEREIELIAGQTTIVRP